MNDQELLRVVNGYLNESNSIRESELDSDMADAIDYYYGNPFGNEIKGRSSVVTRDVMEAVEWALPSIIRVFASGDKFVEFDPVGPDDIEGANQETEYVNHVIIKKNNGWKMFYDWFKGAMIAKNGYVKSWVEEKKTIETTSHSGMTAEQLLEASSMEGAEIIDLEEKFDEDTGETLYDFDLQITKVEKEIKSECVPPEEMKVWNEWNQLSLDGCPFVAHERNMPISDIVAMGFDEDEVRGAATGDKDSDAFTETEIARNRYSLTGEDDDDGEDKSQERVVYSECYVLVDYNGDGISELRQVIKIGSKIFSNKEIDEQPFSTISPMPMPHQHVGMSYAELVMDIQLIKSTLIRQMLDNLYFTNTPEREVVEGMVRMEDLMTTVPGGIKRVQAPGMIREISVPFTAGQSMPMLDILDGMKENRTGISKGSMGLDADVLSKTTRGAFFGAMESASQRIEMVCRVFAETGVKELFRKVHKLAITNIDKDEIIKIRGDYVSVNPSSWRDRTDVTVVVGLGSGNRDQKLSHLSMVAEKQEEHLKNGSPMTDLGRLYNTYEKILNIIGFKDAGKFFIDPNSEEFKVKMQIMAQQPKEPSDVEKTLEVQKEIESLKAQIKAMETREKAILDMQKFQEEMQFKYDKLMKDYQESMTKLELEYTTNVPGAVV